jgi:AraC-like DNA-binding protein
MVSIRCKLLVKEELKKLGFQTDYGVVDFGIVQLMTDITEEQHTALSKRLRRSGLELLDEQEGVLIEKIISVIIEMIHYADELPTLTYAEHISNQLGYEYVYLSTLFSEIKGITIQQFIIYHKIEKAKELLLYEEFTLKQISSKLHYRSIAQLSNQFKKITGHSTAFYKELKQKRKNIIRIL